MWRVLLLVLAAGLLFGGPAWGASGCLRCHEGIKKIAENPVMGRLSCVFCHRGNPEGRTKEEAHQGLWSNPSDLRVVDQTCGQCHGEIVTRLKKSLHATSAGIISAARYTWGAQKTRRALYAPYPVRDEDGHIPGQRGALPELQALPLYDPQRPIGPTNHPVDDYLRAECLRCHIWTRGKERPGDYRSSGCAACHVIYADDGLYRGEDPTIPKDEPGHPRLHRITTRIPVFQCQHCHNRGGRTGVSYMGMMESDGYCSPWSGKAGVKAGRKLHGKCYNHLVPDIHYERGLACIDCHLEPEIHGDGNIYSKKDEAVEIECEDCHGTVKSPAPLRTSRGTSYPNLKRKGSRVILIGKLDGREHPVPQVQEVVQRNRQAAVAMEIPSHARKLECYACHAVWAPQCYGCHAQQNLAEKAGDWLRYGKSADESLTGREKNRLKTAHHWRETRSYLRWESPALGWNAEGKVAPYIPGCQVIFTQIGPDGKPRFLNHIFKTAQGTWGIASNPIQPHTVRPRARSCEDCHANPKALGLGTGLYRADWNGVPFPYGLDQIVTPEGRPIQAVSHDGARPFNGKELRRILRVNICASCHGFMRDPEFWKKVVDRNGRAPDDATHRKVLRHLLRDSVR
ncbi:hypothetical protein FVE67_06880 [Thermosulfurimonas marina]|uniref:Uncharacterized protein n=1 Tax=Thermosulfurimonas marina TaxID=2047767 RepID=A0A6H1WTI7_9BACT|nr:hypothetical protein [Thermosulfurimonas marina]QJA06535.1 hypothetical protein FVE67_06880 [Thermosulfurimonas marina]